MSDRYKFMSTEDGTLTLYDNDFNEAMHTDSGAYEEALIKHLEPSGIFSGIKKRIAVLDIGFGLGYTLLAILHERLTRKSDFILESVSLESSKDLSSFMDGVRFNDQRDESYKIIKKLYSSGKYISDNTKMRMLFGDARKACEELPGNHFDVIFHDPFSPGKNPELWTVEFFCLLKSLMKDDAVLTTYSSAPQIRCAMLRAGLHIGSGPGTGRKKEGTVACVRAFNGELSSSQIEMLLSEPRSVPYHDREFSLDRDTILRERIDKMRIVREGRQVPSE